MQSMSSVRTRMQLSTSIIHFFNHVTLYAFPSVVIFIRDDISLSYSEIGLLGTLPTLLMVMLTPLSGRTRSGLEPLVMLSGLLVMGLSMIMMAMAGDFLDLSVACIVLGVGGAAYHPPGFSIVSQFYEEKKAEALSLNQGAGTVGTGLAPFLLVGGANMVGWQKILIACGGISILTIPLAALLLVGVGDALKSLNSKPPTPQVSDRNRVSQKEGSILLALLTLPLLIALLLSAFRSSVFRIVTFFTVTLMTDFYDLKRSEAGLVSSIILIVGAITAFVGGYISDRMKDGRIKILLFSGSGMVVLSLLLVLLGQQVPNLAGIGIYLIFVCFYFFAAANFTALLAEMVPPHLRTAAYGLNFSLGQLAGALAPTIFGFLLDAYGLTAAMLYLVFVSFSALIVILILDKAMTKPADIDLGTP